MNNTNTKQTREQIREIVKTINQTCMEGKGFEKLKGYFHNDIVMVSPGMVSRPKGRDICVKSYEDACSQMTFEKLDSSDEHIDIYGQTAVACHKYECIWEFKGKKFDETGYEILVFVRNEKDWQIVWRTLIPSSRKIEKCPTEEGETGVQASDDVKQTCLNLITKTLVCQLTTIDSAGFPHTNAMNNLRYAKEYPSLADLFKEEDNDYVLYLSTGMQSPKMARMKANPKVSVYFCDANQITGLMLGGEIEIITDQKLKNRIWQKGRTMYYPNGPEGPEYGVIKLVPSIVKGWCKGRPLEIKI
ncbi:MAG: pyridoxamine 5'-phosphate oxidase family protein [Sedimentisphaerales bacterium]|nr:pyridoxamine 5'-phosphate oxidase family protein [Sedimentisphaerales bacterium]